MLDILKFLKISSALAFICLIESCTSGVHVEDSFFNEWISQLSNDYVKCGQSPPLDTLYKKLLTEKELNYVINKFGTFKVLKIQEINSNIYERGDLPELSKSTFYLNFDEKRTFSAEVYSNGQILVKEIDDGKSPIWIRSYEDLTAIYADSSDKLGMKRFIEINYSECIVVDGVLTVKQVDVICL